MGSQFQQLTSSLGEFSKMATELKRSGEFDETVKLMQIRETTMQDKYKLDVEERKLQIEQIKANAQREETNKEIKQQKISYLIIIIESISIAPYPSLV